jgi:hypothetical protein
MSSIVDLLEKKRKNLGETKTIFALRLFSELKPRSALSFYSQVVRGARVLPNKHSGSIAALLGLPLEQVETSEGITGLRGPFADTVSLDAEELRYLANIAEVAGGKISLHILIKLLLERAAKS